MPWIVVATRRVVSLRVLHLKHGTAPAMIRLLPEPPELYLVSLRTRMPFRYGITTMTALPHLIVRLAFEIDGRRQHGVAADHLAPKWFTKDPATAFRDDVADMLAVTRQAIAHAGALPAQPTAFELWRQLYAAQQAWAAPRGYPPLLWHFGVSFVERALLDAYCRASGATFFDALRANAFGLQMGEVHPALAGAVPADSLPARPRKTIAVRHTVGLADPLTEADITPAEHVDDGLPQSLEGCIRAYGLSYFKIKIGGDPDEDLPRLRRVAAVLAENVSGPYRFTLDGNEQYRDARAFRGFWETLARDPALSGFLRRLLFVEQPLHRDAALSDETAGALHDWPGRPPLLIDEADADLESLPRALACGYAGTSHKNCKGVFKGVLNAALLAHHRRLDPGGHYVLSGEDLSNTGPIALLQDLTVTASLGLAHVERNGHHYFRGLSGFPKPVQAQVQAAHPDLYRHHPGGFPTLDVRQGQIRLGSLLAAPFGTGFDIETASLVALPDWHFEMLEADGP